MTTKNSCEDDYIEKDISKLPKGTITYILNNYCSKITVEELFRYIYKSLYIDKIGVKEISKELGIPSSTIRGWINRMGWKTLGSKPANTKPIEMNFPENIINYKLDEEIEQEIRKLIGERYAKEELLIEEPYDIYYLLINVYKTLFVFKYTTGELGEFILNRTRRPIQRWLKKLGWELDAFEIQQRIVARGRRDYKQIKNKGKQTILKNYYSVDGNNPEEYTRKSLNLYLPTILSNSEIIVGLNNGSILEGGNEVDIPIIIFHNNKIYKYSIEYNGDFWHENKKRDDLKKEMINNKGYHLFYIEPKHTITEKQLMEFIDDQIVKIGKYIKEDLKIKEQT